MSAKAIREATGKNLLNKLLKSGVAATTRFASVDASTDWDALAQDNPWLKSEKLVAKPDQLIKRRGKLGLIKVKADYDEVKQWITERMNTDIKIGSAVGKLKSFIIEPFVAHQQNEEFYVCIYSDRDGDTILFHHEGGVEIGDVDAKASKLAIAIDAKPTDDEIMSKLLSKVSSALQGTVLKFVQSLYTVYCDLYFTYLEINPLVATGGKVYILDLAAKLDQCAEYLCKQQWGEIDFPPPFGREAFPEEAYIADLDAKSGASLKLTILNSKGRIWTMVAGGGASVIYADTICDMGGAVELANYGEYSGAPSEGQTYEYAKTILGLMTKEKHAEGKVLIVGGGIANFTNVAATFKGIVRALREYQQKLIDGNVSIFVRRAGPNFQEGLRIMRELGETLGVPIHVFGPETHMTAIVGMALGKKKVPPPAKRQLTTANFLLPGGQDDQRRSSEGHELESEKSFKSTITNETSIMQTKRSASRKSIRRPRKKSRITPSDDSDDCDMAQNSSSSPTLSRNTSDTNLSTDSGVANSSAASGVINTSDDLKQPIFTRGTKAIVWGMQSRAVQGMLDFDYSCSRSSPSVVAMVYPFVGDHKQKFYWGHKEVLIPVYKKMDDAMKKHPTADVVVNFASLRSAYDSTIEAMAFEQVRTIAIIAEGIPENMTRKLIQMANKKNVTIIGPATVGGIKPGCFKIGNTGGMLDNILSSKLYRPGSVAYVSRSGGMSNELNNIIAMNTNGVYEGVAIGGDRYPGTSFMDHITRYQDDPEVKMLVLLGEVGGTEEYKIIEAIKSGRLTKPIVGWCIGTCAKMFTSEVQFGHAGSCANAEAETANAKNQALRAAGVHVPPTFDELDDIIKQVYEELVTKGVIVPKPEMAPPTVPMDYNWARELGLIRKPASFMTSICDERGQELLYAGVPITEVFKEDLGIGGVLSLLWFQKRLPAYACKFIEMCLMVTADHGPAVSGAHNTIVCARAGKDLISSLASGLLTIGDRFGGALDGAAKQFTEAYDAGMIPMEFVNSMRKKGQLIMGIGHRVKSINNPDMRVVILKEYAKENFPSSPLLDYACEVEKITTSKKPNLILNVDGLIGVVMVDLLRNCGCFTREEAAEYVEIGALNGLFVLGRSIGFIGHYLDQKRLKQGLYRHPWDDISYVLPEQYGQGGQE